MNILYRLKSHDLEYWVGLLGVAGLFFCTFGIFGKKSIAHAGFGLMAVSLLFMFKSLGRKFLRDRLFLLSLLFLLFLAVRSVMAMFEFTGHMISIAEGALKLLGAGFFGVFVFAFWMNRARDKWSELLLVLMAGYLFQILRQIDWAHF